MPPPGGAWLPRITVPSRQALKKAPSFRLTAELVAQYGGGVVCLDSRAIGQRHKLYASRPGPAFNERITRTGYVRDDVIQPNGAVLDVPGEADPAVTVVRIDGPIEQRSGYHDLCSGWSDGHDAIAERMVAALEEGNVVLVIDSPGGAHAGLQEAIRKVVQEKEEHGRHVTVFADEMIGSAAYWWAACVGDEIYGPESMIVGSIGARAAHGSIAGALEKEGVAVTYFAWPGDGKVAFAPELPLSELGRERGNRDVSIAGEAFAAAIGPRRGLSREQIVELNADAMHGQMAFDAGLVDGIAPFEEVMNYALALAGADTGEDGMDLTKPGNAVRSETDPEKNPDEPPPKADKYECKNCGMANDDDAKFCDQCGKSMSGDDEEEERSASADDDDDDDDKPGMPEKANQPPPPDQDRRAQIRGGSIASIFGLPEKASMPAVKSAAIAYASLGRAVMAATGAKSPAEAEGALRSVVDDASEVVKLRAEIKASRKRENFRERMDLLRSLAAADIPGYSRGDLFVDKEIDGKLVQSPAPLYATASLDTVRGLVRSKLHGRAAPQRTPFEPNQEKAKEAQTESLVREAQATPVVQNIVQRSSASAEQLARTAAALEAQGAIQ